MNGYSLLLSGADNKRVGGLVGYAENMEIANCYVYGEMEYSEYSGGLIGSMGSDVNISNSYYLSGMVDSAIGYNTTHGRVAKMASFSGKGNKVKLSQRVDGYDNMTRALNKWVDAQADTSLFHWRSDIEELNSGYPMFGTPDIISVYDTMQLTVCDSYDDGNTLYDESGIYVIHVVDSADYLDSTMTLMLTVNHGDTTAIIDTIRYGDSYQGNGFSLSAEEIKEMARQHKPADVWSLQRVDSLYNANGCDSTVVLTLYVVGSGVDIPQVVRQLDDVKVYPNPTRGMVTVEGSNMKSIEVYDVSSRMIMKVEPTGDKYQFDLSRQSSGSYYLRITTEQGTVVKKVIKK